MTLKKNLALLSFHIITDFLLLAYSASISGEINGTTTSSMDNTNRDTQDASCTYGHIAYRHGSPVNNTDFCQPCICFHGNIMCRVIKCPGKPSPDCVVADLHNSCCPIFECPKIKFLPSVSPKQEEKGQENNNSKENNSSECEAAGGHFMFDDVIPSLSGPCLECRCTSSGFIRCFPLPCREEERQPLYYQKELFKL